MFTKLHVLFVALLSMVATLTTAMADEGDATQFGGEDRYYHIVWHNNTSSYLTEKSGGTLQVEGPSAKQKQYWQFLPTGKPNCYYIRNAVSGRYVEACRTTSNNSYNIGTVDAPVEYYVSQESAVGGAYRLTSTNCANYSDTSKGPVGLNKNGANSSIITWSAGTSNTGSYWDIRETPLDYDFEGAALLTQHTAFARQSQVYFMPCGSFLATYCVKKLKLTGSGCVRELEYPCATWSGTARKTGVANTSSWWTLYTTDKGEVVPGGELQVDVSLAAIPASGYLAQVCFDWDHDGEFEDVQTIEEPKTRILSFHTTVPADAVMGESRMRFRMTVSGDAGPDAEVSAGQILDCLVYTIPQPEPVVTVSVNDSTRGSALYDAETGKVQAIPCGNARFLCWMEGRKVVSVTSTYTLTDSRPHHLTALFSANTTDERPVAVQDVAVRDNWSSPVYYELSGRLAPSPAKGKPYIRKDSPRKGRVIIY